MTAFLPAMREDELWAGEMRAITLAGRRVLLLRLQDRGVRAYVDRCAHLGLPLGDGAFAGSVLTCRHHCYKYDASTGCGLKPANAALVPLPVRVIAGEILVGLGPAQDTPQDVGEEHDA
ncbi:MAG TPA: Rieske 2Fe-2S domain-containing protein [Polyangiaceae bacterium]